MFTNILSFWKGRDFLEQTINDFAKMLENSQMMFQLVCEKLIENKGDSGLQDKIYTLDKEINELEKSIRKRVVEHLIMQPTVDVSACLMLMSVVKDAERLGDYCKNLFEVTKILKKPLDQGKYEQYFNNLHGDLLNFFKETKKAFVESDENIAALTWEYKDKISKQCDQAIDDVASSDLSTNEAVGIALIARHYKRLSSHLVNIATSVILPIDELDYFDERKKG